MSALIERYFALYDNISSLPIFKENITAETLSMAGKMYFYLIHCADISAENVPWVSFYVDLFERHSLKTILITLARFSSFEKGSNSNTNSDHKRIAMEFFSKLSDQVDLVYQDIDAVTLSLPEMRNVTSNTAEADNTEIREVINHPVHIINHQGRLSPSAFIPFCAFGGEMDRMGEKIPQFSFPVCSAFTQHIGMGPFHSHRQKSGQSSHFWTKRFTNHPKKDLCRLTEANIMIPRPQWRINCATSWMSTSIKLTSTQSHLCRLP